MTFNYERMQCKRCKHPLFAKIPKSEKRKSFFIRYLCTNPECPNFGFVSIDQIENLEEVSHQNCNASYGKMGLTEYPKKSD